jgi:hypothetical protein
MKRFYTLPEPFNNKYPFLLAPFPNKHKRLRTANFKHAIVDSGVELFAHGKKDYPLWFHSRYQHTAKQWTEIYGDRIWFVIPDYPDDYRNNPIENNIAKTLRNIKVYHEVKDVNWVYPIQSDYLNLQSFHDSCHQVMKFNPEQVAIGTVCKCRNLDFIEACCKIARQHFYTQHIHAFGPTLSALPRILPFIDSWDSTAYFCSRESGRGKCHNQKEREEYYFAYLKRVNKILNDFHCQTRLLEVNNDASISTQEKNSSS